MLRFAIPTLLALGAIAGTAAAARDSQERDPREAAKLARALDGLTPGKPMKCLHPGRITELRSFEGTILYVEGRDRVYRNDVVGHCNGLARDDMVVSLNPSGNVCEGNIIQTRARTGGQFTGSCSLGAFTPYTKGGK